MTDTTTTPELTAEDATGDPWTCTGCGAKLTMDNLAIGKDQGQCQACAPAELTTASRSDCDECNGHVRPGELCGKCGNNKLNQESDIFLQATQLPYCPPRLDCCRHAAIQINLDPDGRSLFDVIVTHNHSADCDVWRFI